MTRSLIRAAYLLIAAALLLTGCGAETPAPSAPPPEFARGVWNDGTYTSEYASLSFTLPDGWEISPDAELLNDMKIRDGELAKAGEPFTETMLALDEITDMRASSGDTDSFVLVGYANLANITGGVEFSEDEFFEYEKGQMDDVDGSSNFTYGDFYRVKTINGKTYTVLDAELEGYGVSIYYAARRIGDYMLVVIITAINESAEDILPNFF